MLRHPTRRVFLAGNPTGAWTTQAAQNLFLDHATPLAGSRALARDRGSQFIDSFDEIVRTEGLKILKGPVRTPVANSNGSSSTTSTTTTATDLTALSTNDHRWLPRRRRPPGQRHLQVVKSAQCDGLLNEYRNAA